jgi:hypothetical protein
MACGGCASVYEPGLSRIPIREECVCLSTGMMSRRRAWVGIVVWV